MKKAGLYKRIDDNTVQCFTCAHRCRILSGKRGICGVRENKDGILYTLVYGRAVAANSDPIEKKPLFHFLPGTLSFSVATVGCNMHCNNCQNSDISQMSRKSGRIMGSDLPPEKIIQIAIEEQCSTIAYTYTEPAVFFDYAYDTAKLAHERGIKNIFVTNGYFSEESFRKISKYMDGANVDLKFFNNNTYRKICGAELMPVLKTIERMKSSGIWVEVTTLLIPELNDSEKELNQIADFINNCDPCIPWHISRFYPTYKMTERPPTSVNSIQKARKIGLKAGLSYVYTGNIPGDEGENTFCPSCGILLINRIGFNVSDIIIRNGKCPECGAEISGVWK